MEDLKDYNILEIVTKNLLQALKHQKSRISLLRKPQIWILLRRATSKRTLLAGEPKHRSKGKETELEIDVGTIVSNMSLQVFQKVIMNI